MSGLDSLAVLQERARSFGLPEATLKLLTVNGVDSLGKMAFISNYQPGQADESPIFQALESVIGRSPSAAEKPIFRRLYFESNTATLADMRARVERTDTSEPRKLPMAERSSRLALQKGRLSGVVMTLDNEPTSRAQESTNIKKVVTFQLDASGNLKARQNNDDTEARLTGNARLRRALQRRAFAYDLTRMVEYTTLEKWSELLFAEMLREPPKMYQAITAEQVQEADKKLWQLVSEAARGSVAMKADNSKPVDVAINARVNSSEVRLLLQPLPRARQAEAPQPAKATPGQGSTPPPTKKQKVDLQVPSDCSAFTDANKPCCRNFNTKGCSFAKPGKRCKFGFHVCWKKGCNRPCAQLHAWRLLTLRRAIASPSRGRKCPF